MDRASSSSAGATPPDLDGLLDELAISRTILASLQEGPHDSNTPTQISAAKKDVARLQKDISRARGSTQGPTYPPPPPPPIPTLADPGPGSKRAANSNGAMQWYRSDDYAGECLSSRARRDPFFAGRQHENHGCILRAISNYTKQFPHRPKFLPELRKPHARQCLHVSFCLWSEEADLWRPSR